VPRGVRSSLGPAQQRPDAPEPLLADPSVRAEEHLDGGRNGPEQERVQGFGVQRPLSPPRLRRRRRSHCVASTSFVVSTAT